MNYITVQEASDKWGISPRRICILCADGRIPGAVKRSKVWMIPAIADKPGDGRKKNAKKLIEPILLFYNPTLLDDALPGTYENEAYTICEIQKQFLVGQYENAFHSIRAFITSHSDSRYLCVAYYIYLKIATDMGLKDEIDFVHRHLRECFEDNKNYRVEAFLQYFYQGRMELFVSFDTIADIYDDARPILSLITIKRNINHLLKSGLSQDVSAYELLCNELENKNCPEIVLYCHLYLAVYYVAQGFDLFSDFHIKKAADIGLQRGWYMPFAEYASALSFECIKAIDFNMYEQIKKLSKIVSANYVKIGVLSEIVEISENSTKLNVQIGYKILQGKSNEEIAESLGISKYKVRKQIEEFYGFAGISSRKEIREFVRKNLFL